MHEHVEVIVPEAGGPEEAVRGAEMLLAPFSEEGENFDWDAYKANDYEGGWDWYQVGGRWRGVHLAGETISNDIASEVCVICGGSGRRADAAAFERENPGWLEWSGGCNGCEGKGVQRPWPTSWPVHPLDAAVESDVFPGLTAHAYLDVTGWHVLKDEQVPRISGAWYVTMDCHS